MVQGLVSTFVFLIYFLASQMPEGITSVRVKQLKIPPRIYVGEKVLLKCDYDLGNNTQLYSLKWYKDNLEIYRFVPKSKTPIKIYPVHGVKIDRKNSVPEALLLEDADTRTAGVYACEVSGESPLFNTKYVQKEMVVSRLPADGPKLSGLKKRYVEGELIEANCTSPKSTPAPLLKFFINRKKVDRDYIINYRKDHYGNDLERATLGLRIFLNDKMIRRRKIHIKCVAKIKNVYNKVVNATVTAIPYSEAKLIVSQNQFLSESSKEKKRNGNWSCKSYDKIQVMFLFHVILLLNVLLRNFDSSR
ncbi:Uncharacterised protein g5582 [Pycnogonum litorale]